jgi:hypothetical protein
MPQLRDAYNQLTIGPPHGTRGNELIAAGATQIVFRADGSRAGVYVDCETGTATTGTPTQRDQRDQTARKLHSMGENVWMTLYPDESGHTVPGCVTMLLWYPTFGACPTHEGYCLWWDFAPPGSPAASMLARAQQLVNLSNRRPKALWTY